MQHKVAFSKYIIKKLLDAMQQRKVTHHWEEWEWIGIDPRMTPTGIIRTDVRNGFKDLKEKMNMRYRYGLSA